MSEYQKFYRRDGTPYPPGADACLEWAKDFETMDIAERIVKQDRLPNGYFVSTVWLGLNHNFTLYGPPLIFETMIMNPSGKWEDYQERYSSENDAIVGHLIAVDLYAAK